LGKEADALETKKDETREVLPPHAVRHYTVNELAKTWNLSDETIVKLFESEPGVIVISERRKSSISRNSVESHGTHYVIRMRHCSTRWERRWEPYKLCSVTPHQKSRVRYIYTLFPKINDGQWQELNLLFLGSIGLKRTQL
jgi:hypothetical protein